MPSLSGKDSHMDFDQARVLYAAFLAGCPVGETQGQAFKRLLPADRKVVAKAIEILKKNEKELRKNLTDGVTSYAEGSPLEGLARRLSNSYRNVFSNKQLLDDLQEGKGMVIPTEAEIVLANRFLFPAKRTLTEMNEGGALYTQLQAICKDTAPSKKQRIEQAIEQWIETLDPGQEKTTAQETLKTVKDKLKGYNYSTGFNERNLVHLAEEFRTTLHDRITAAWEKEPLTTSDLRAMGIGPLELAPFLTSQRLLHRQKKDFERTVQEISGSLQEAQKIYQTYPTLGNAEEYYDRCNSAMQLLEKKEAELLPFVRYPEFAVLYSKVLGERLLLIEHHVFPSQFFIQKPGMDLEAYKKGEFGSDFKTFEQRTKGITLELTKLQYLYAQYGASQGIAEGLLIFAKGVLEYGDFSKADTIRELLKLNTQLQEIAEKRGDKKLLQSAKLLKADIYRKEYLTAKAIGQNEKLPEMVARAEKAYKAVGVGGIPGLYNLFMEAGISADPMIDLLGAKLMQKNFLSKQKPSIDDLEKITAAALAGNEKAKVLLKGLQKLYPIAKSKEGSKSFVENNILAASHLLTNGNLTGSKEGQEFSEGVAARCYVAASFHLYHALDTALRANKGDDSLKPIVSNAIVLKEKIDLFDKEVGFDDEEREFLQYLLGEDSKFAVLNRETFFDEPIALPSMPTPSSPKPSFSEQALTTLRVWFSSLLARFTNHVAPQRLVEESHDDKRGQELLEKFYDLPLIDGETSEAAFQRYVATLSAEDSEALRRAFGKTEDLFGYSVFEQVWLAGQAQRKHAASFERSPSASPSVSSTSSTSLFEPSQEFVNEMAGFMEWWKTVAVQDQAVIREAIKEAVEDNSFVKTRDKIPGALRIQVMDQARRLKRLEETERKILAGVFGRVMYPPAGIPSLDEEATAGWLVFAKAVPA